MAKLFIVATPIGNLKDFTFRAVECLKVCDLVLAEDTRESQKLLNAYEIKKPLMSFEKHNAKKRSQEVLRLLEEGKNIALLTDAGTPGISDPGFELVAAAKGSAIEIIPIPGASALTCALSASGFDASDFYFGGFLPAKTAERKKILSEKLESSSVTVFFESTHRIEKTLAELETILENLGQSEREIFLARELTKKFETHYRGNIKEIKKQVELKETLGEWVLIIGPNRRAGALQEEELKQSGDWRKLKSILEDSKISRKDQINIIGKLYGLPRNFLYKEIGID
jgi:16S rRNA (cytidine1402-2'-O)-methyltransferase